MRAATPFLRCCLGESKTIICQDRLWIHNMTRCVCVCVCVCFSQAVPPCVTTQRMGPSRTCWTTTCSRRCGETPFWSRVRYEQLNITINFGVYQDRFGTTIGKAENERRIFLQESTMSSAPLAVSEVLSPAALTVRQTHVSVSRF